MGRVSVCAVFALFLCAPALGKLYWVAWDASMGYPEDNGWHRAWGNWQGPHQGGAFRSLDGGALNYDSLYDPGVCDFSEMDRPGQIDPGPGETFVMEWRLKVDAVTDWWYDPGVGVKSNSARLLGLGFGRDRIYCVTEDYLQIPIVPGVYHDYRVESSDMWVYKLFIDNNLARTGSFWQGVTPASVGWGDNVQGAASLHHWEYFRFGVVPEPASGLSIAVIAGAFVCGGRRRSW